MSEAKHTPTPWAVYDVMRHTDYSSETPGWINETSLIDECLLSLHEGLGGNGWAYSNYGDDELKHKRDELAAGVEAVITVLRRRGLLNDQGVEIVRAEMGDRK